MNARRTSVLAALTMVTLFAAAQQASISYKVPEGWTVSPEPRQMRHATLLTASKTEVVVSMFPGDVGGTLANLNRWRTQVGLGAIQQGDVEKNTTKVQTAAPGVTAMVVDFTGPGGRVLAAIVPQGERTWFIRTLGEAEAVGKTKEGFDAMVKSVAFAGK